MSYLKGDGNKKMDRKLCKKGEMGTLNMEGANRYAPRSQKRKKGYEKQKNTESPSRSLFYGKGLNTPGDHLEEQTHTRREGGRGGDNFKG